MSMLTVSIGGLYYRIADPDWADPLDPSFAWAPPGRRWNPTGLACLYLNHDQTTAPLLLGVDVPDGEAAGTYTDAGLAALGLPDTYRHRTAGDVIPHHACQPNRPGSVRSRTRRCRLSIRRG